MFPITMHFNPQISNDMPFGLKAGFGSGEVHQVLGAPYKFDHEMKVDKYEIGTYQVYLLYSFSDDDVLEAIRVMKGRRERT